MEKEYIDNIKKHRKNDMKFSEALNEIENFIQSKTNRINILLSERKERLIIFIIGWSFSLVCFITGSILKIPSKDIEIAVSGTNQSGNIKGSTDIYLIGILFFAAPLLYLLIRKFKGKEKTVYVDKT